MKSRLVFTVLLVVMLVSSMVTPLAVAQRPGETEAPVKPSREAVPAAALGVAPEGAGVESLTGSYVEFDPLVGGDSCFAPGMTQTFCFEAYSYSPDWDFGYEFWLRFPTDWTVTNVYVQGTPSCSGGGSFGSFSWSFQTAPYEVRVSHPRFHDSGGGSCTAYYCFDVTSGTGAPDALQSWYWRGDGWGSPPYRPCSNDGYTPPGQTACDEQIHPPAAIPPCELDPIMLTPALIEEKGCPCEVQEHGFMVWNNTGYDTDVDLTYTITAGDGTCTGPASVYLVDGTSEEITVELYPVGAFGDEVVCEVYAEDASEPENNDTSWIVKELIEAEIYWEQIATAPTARMDNVAAGYDDLVWSITGYGAATPVNTYDPATNTWATVAGSAPPFGVNYARSGCHPYGSAAENKVFVYGDSTTSGFTGLWSYDMDANVWTNEAPGGTPPAQTGIWSPAWTYDADDELCYLTGGATAPGGGNLTTVYVYDPVANAWLDPLPNFTNPRAFHAAFMVEGMVCVMGGVDAGSVVHSSTQCYDGTAWNAENADIPALPMGWWGMGYASKLHAGTDLQLWLVNGADAAFALIPTTYYYDVNGGVWVEGGPLASGVFYRTAATNLNGELYHVAGSTGGFNYSGLSDRHVQLLCDPCPIDGCTVFFDDFESGYDNWTMTGLWHAENEAGVCGSLVAPFPSPENSVYYAVEGQCTYNDGAHNWGYLSMVFDVDLTAAPTATLEFGSYEQTECGGGNCGFDERFVQVSTDGGGTWQTVWGSTGPEGSWYEASADLDAYVGGPLRIRFYFDTYDAWVNDYFGWMVDDVHLKACVGVIDDPVIEVTPESLYAEQCADEVTEQTLQICNVGGAELEWSISKQPASGLASLVPLEGTTGPLAGWHESDTPPPGLDATRPAGPAPEAWGEGTVIPTGAQYQGAGVTIDNENFYLIGGYTTTYLNQNLHYNTTTGEWTTMTPMSIARGNLFAYYNPGDGMIYVPGGWNGSYLNHNHRYDPVTDTWQALAPLPIAKSGANGGIVDGRMFLFGGNGGTAYNETQIYDIATDTWYAGTPMPVGTHRYGGNVTYEGQIYVMGAFDAAHFMRYDPATDTWEQGPSMTVARNSPNCLVTPDAIIYCWGGGDGWSGRYDGEMYDLAAWPGGSWTTVTDPIPYGTVRSGHACAGDRLWVEGGAPSPYHNRNQWWEGLGMTCYWPGELPPPDVPWLSADPITGTLPVGQCQDVTVTFDSTGMDPGDYFANLLIDSNDPANPQVVVPVQLMVDPCLLFDAWKEAPEFAAHGETIQYTIVIDAEELLDGMYMVDPLPAGVEYAGNLEWNVGYAWYDDVDNTVYWEYGGVRGNGAALRGSMPFVPVNVAGEGVNPGLTAVSPQAEPVAVPPSPQDVLWDQPLSTVNQNAYVNQEFPDAPDYSSFLADDFYNTEPWEIHTIFVPGNGWNNFTTIMNATALTWQIYADDGGVPDGDPSGAGNPPVWTLTLPPTDPQVVITNGTGGMPSNVELNLATPGQLPPGHWWLVFYPTMEFGVGGQYGRQPADTTNGYWGQFVNPGGGFGYGTGWQPWSNIGADRQDIAFRIEGIAGDGPQQAIISFDVTVTADAGTIIVNEGWAGLEGQVKAFSAETEVVGAPVIVVDPLALEAELCPDETETVELEICNQGDAPLHWEIQGVELPTGLIGSVPFFGRTEGPQLPAPSIPAEVFTGVVPEGYVPQAGAEWPAPDGPWQTRASAPFVSMDNVYLDYDGKGYLVSGYGANGQVGIYNPDTDSWTTGATEPTPWIEYPIDGCLGMNADGDPVAVLFNDTTSGATTLHRYNIATNSWDTPPVPAGFPANGLWAHDIASVWRYSGENVCYISGGATTPGGGNTSALYAYYPDTNTAVNLGNFNYLAQGFAFHASWYVPWIGASGGICVGGGVNAGSVVSGDTQCYDIAAGVFNAANADLGPLPAGLWGMADGVLYEDGDYQLWVAQGADAAFALWPNSAYYSQSSGQWHLGPTPPRTGYRVEGTNIAAGDGCSFYVVGGSSGGFTPTSGHERNYSPDCPPVYGPGVPWLIIDPTSGTVPPGECQVVEVTFDATELEPGEYLANLLISSNDPETPLVTVPVTMTVLAPVEIIEVTYEIDGLEVAFEAMVEGAEPITFAWDFGDGETSDEQNPVHVYAEAGCYEVTLVVSNACALDSWTEEICVEVPCEPVEGVDFEWTPEVGIVGEAILFTALEPITGTAPFEYSWDFGDGWTGTGITVTHVFEAAGVYTVTLTVENDCSLATVEYLVTVEEGIMQIFLPVVLRNH